MILTRTIKNVHPHRDERYRGTTLVIRKIIVAIKETIYNLIKFLTT